MSDDITLQSGTLASPPSGTVVETVDQGGGVQRQVVQVEDGAGLAVTVANPGDFPGGVTADTTLRTSATPTISASAIYALGDVVGTLLTFANIGSSSGGSTIRVVGVDLADKTTQVADLDLVLFKVSSFTLAADNAAFDPADSDLTDVVGIIPVGSGHYSVWNDNSAARVDCDVRIVLPADDLYGVLVARSTPTYASTSDLTVSLTTIQS